MQGLPDPIHTVQHSVVHEERRVVRAAKEIGGVTADFDVASGMQAQESVAETSLKLVLECVYALGSLAERQVVEAGQGKVFGSGDKIASSASWVVLERCAHSRVSVHSWEDWTEIELQTVGC